MRAINSSGATNPNHCVLDPGSLPNLPLPLPLPLVLVLALREDTAMTSKKDGKGPLRPIEGMSIEEKRRLVDRLAAVMMRLISDVAAMGRIDLVAPLHDAYLMMKHVAPELASSETFGELVAAAARLIRIARHATRSAPSRMTVY
jgi:hypothetical protein